MSETVNAGCAGPAAPAVRLRRVIDVLGAGTAIFVSLPILLVIALAVWIEGGRPILYSQLRLGLNGAPFRMYKFRKFRADCDDRGSPLTMVNDNRMTTIGGLLAAFKLDELPQLWNILRGDMSFVGPRPETLVFADCFRNGFKRSWNTGQASSGRARFSSGMKMSCSRRTAMWRISIGRFCFPPRRRSTWHIIPIEPSRPISGGSFRPAGSPWGSRFSTACEDPDRRARAA